MRGKYLAYGMLAGVLLAIAINNAPAGQTIQPFVNSDSANVDPTGTMNPGPPGVPVDPINPGPGGVAAVPEPTTIAMLLLGSGCAGAFTTLRRRSRGG